MLRYLSDRSILSSQMISYHWLIGITAQPVAYYPEIITACRSMTLQIKFLQKYYGPRVQVGTLRLLKKVLIASMPK
jgi:hypothetical protein